MTTPDINRDDNNLPPLNLTALDFFSGFELREPPTQKQLIDYLNQKPNYIAKLASCMTAGAMMVGSSVALAHYGTEFAAAFHNLQMLT